MNTLKIGGLALAISATILAIVYMFVANVHPVLGSAVQGNDYSATTTRNFDGAAKQSVALVKGGYGSLGSVIITGAGAGQITFYDATTSDATKRSANQSTSTITLADIHTSAAAGTYVFDIAYGRGLLMTIAGTAPTSTVTYR